MGSEASARTPERPQRRHQSEARPGFCNQQSSVGKNHRTKPPAEQRPRTGFQTPGYYQIKMLCDPVKEGGPEEGSSLQPWQIYSGLFLGFWAFSTFFDHFLATALLCLVFGAAGDQLTRYMYTLGSSSKATGDVVTLLDMAKQEVRPLLSLSQASLVPSLTQMAKKEFSGKAVLHEEILEEEEEYDESELPPPPVPARRDDIAERLGGVTEKLQQLTRERGDGPTEL